MCPAAPGALKFALAPTASIKGEGKERQGGILPHSHGGEYEWTLQPDAREAMAGKNSENRAEEKRHWFKPGDFLARPIARSRE